MRTGPVGSRAESIWNSACRFAAKVEAQPGYLSPEAYAELTSLRPDDFTDVGQASVLTAESRVGLESSGRVNRAGESGVLREWGVPKGAIFGGEGGKSPGREKGGVASFGTHSVERAPNS